MTDFVPVQLGEVLTPVAREVTLQPDEEYATIGVYSFGRGLFERPVIKGRDTSYRSYFRVSAGDFVYSKLFAWEGALAVAPSALDGFYVSPEFPTFTINQTRVHMDYLDALCRWPRFWESVRAQQKGMGGRRKRVYPANLLQVTVPIPPREVQDRITDLIGAAREALVRARQAEEAAETALTCVARGYFTDPDHPQQPLSEIADVTMGRQRAPQFAAGEHMVPYLRAANVKDDRLELDDVLSMNFTPAEQTKFHLEDGDVLVTEGCGSLKQIGACAVWRGELEGSVCFQNTLIRLRARPGRSLPNYLAQWSRWAYRDGVYAAVASGTNIYHIGSTRAADISVAAPPLDEQERIGALLDALTGVRRAAATERIALEQSLGALLDDLLSGEYQIPDDYTGRMEQAS